MHPTVLAVIVAGSLVANTTGDPAVRILPPGPEVPAPEPMLEEIVAEVLDPYADVIAWDDEKTLVRYRTAVTPAGRPAGGRCAQMTVTAYSQQQFPGRGAHGWPVVGATAAASWNIPEFTVVWIAGVGARTINDRGHLGSTGHIDVFMATTAQAVHFGSSQREVCW